MTGINRLPGKSGLLIERASPVTFAFERRPFSGLGGDTIASALAASDQWLLSRSFKYHRPRGVLTMAGQDANTLVQLPDEPNVLADRHPIRPGLEVLGQNYRGSLADDKEARIALLARFLPVGFYYKAFFKPRGAWKLWEPIIRARAGLGRVNPAAPHGYYDKAYGFCDVAVVGGGPGGIAAALEAADAGAEVILIDENPLIGGSLTYARFDAEGARGPAIRRELLEALAARSNITTMSNAICNGWFADNFLPVIRGNRLYKIRAKEAIMASGSIEQPAVFRNNDLPGVMQGSAAQRLIHWYAVRPGRRAVVLTANRHGYGVALDLWDAGVEVAALVDLRPEPAPDDLIGAVRARRIEILWEHTVAGAAAGSGNHHVEGVLVSRIVGQGECASRGRFIDCDLVCMSPGYMPAYQLLGQAGARLSYREERASFVPATLPPHLHATGSVADTWSLDAVLASGRLTGWQAARNLGLGSPMEPAVVADQQASPNHPWPIFPHPAGKDFVDFDEDLQVNDILNACADGYDDVQLVKRYSTAGMGPSQGRHSALTTARLTARATGRSLADAEVTTARPPFTAEKLGNVAGRGFEPVRYTPMHHRHVEAGAQMLIAGLWLRPAYYGAPGKRDECMRNESVHVRSKVGLIDVSTLGGLEVRGPDAGEFLNRIYLGGLAKQEVGRGRYVVMTNEQGVVIDDGVAARLHERHYYVTATTSGVDNVYRSMLHWNAQWRLDVDVSNVSAAWSGVNVAGPGSRAVLARLCSDVDLAAEALPYMGVREGSVGGIPARLMRVGFVGELGFEVHVPSTYGEALWDRFMEAGAEDEIAPFGVETQRLLRLEKGHLIIGQDTDSMSHPHEVHLGGAIARRKPFFVGRRALDIIMQRPLARMLVGFTIDDKSTPVPEESHLVIRDDEMTGRVTSCYFSPTLDKTIGLAYVHPTQASPDTLIRIRTDDAVMVDAKVSSLPFYDPENRRQAG